MAKITREQQKAIAEWVAPKKCLVLDSSSSSRPVVRKLMIESGMKNTCVEVAENFEDAVKKIESSKPDIVWTEYNLGNRTGLDLLPFQKKLFKSRFDYAFFLLSEKNSLAIAAHSAEQDADSLVLRPITMEILKDQFAKVALEKMSPSDYDKLLDDGRRILDGGDAEQAISFFIEARKANKSPALACYYEAVCHKILGDLKSAEARLAEGLKFDPKHYKCSAGAFEIFFEAKQYDKAYERGKFLFEEFPANPKHLPNLLWLSIYHKRYADVLGFYEVFSKIEPFDEVLANYMAAGLYVCGKFFLQEGNGEDAVGAFKKADKISRSKQNILKEIALTLIAHEKNEDAKYFLERLPTEIKDSPEFLIAELEVLMKKAEPGKALVRGLELIKQGVQHERLYESVLGKMVEMKRNYSNIEDILYKAIAAFPKSKEKFEKIIPSDYTGK